MKKKILEESAQELKQASISSYEEYRDKADQLIYKINGLMIERVDIEKLVGETNITMMKDNHANHVRFIASILKNYSPSVLVDTVLWVFRAYRSHGFTSNYWTAQLNTWILIIKETLTPECFKEVYPYYEWMQINIPIFVLLSDEKLESSNLLH